MSEAGSGIGRRALVIALFVVSQVVVAFGVVEVGARLLDPLGISYYPETARLLDRMIQEEPIGYRLPPGLDGRFHGVRIQTNAQGMRDREVPARKQPGEKRILVIGDSVAFSIGVESEETVPHQLEVLANRGAPPGVHYRTLNMGVPSYNTEQERVQLEEVGLSLDPDVAVLLFMENDIEPKMWVFDKRADWKADLAQRSYAASLAFVLLRRTREAAGQTVELVQAGSYQEENPRWEAIEAALLAIQGQLRERGIPLLVLYTPRGSAAQLIHQVGERGGFPVRRIDVFADPRWSHLDPAEHRNSSVDSHCNPAGCRLEAQVIYEALVAEGLVATRQAAAGSS